MRTLGALGALYGLAGVALGAFAAHFLEGRLTERGQELLDTAVRYQLVHALALVLAALWAHAARDAASFRWAAAAFAAGVPLFSGSLVALAFGAPRALGAITPLGGTLFLLGWVAMAIGVWRSGG